MPYPNEHSCRLRDPGDFMAGSFRRTDRKSDGKKYSVILGRLKGEDTLTEQAYRYNKDTWTAGDARAHCEDHDGILFEPAEPEQDNALHLSVEDGAGYAAPPPEDWERRNFELSNIRAYPALENSDPQIVGHAAVFGTESQDLGGFIEIVEPGAFTKTLGESDVRALWQHDERYVFGRTGNQTVRIKEDQQGLAFEINPPKTTWAADALISIDRGDVHQMSFGFRAVRDRWEKPEEGPTIRRLIEVQLYDISPVTFPAYVETSAQVRAMVSSLSGQPSPTPPEVGHLEDDGEVDPQVRIALLRRLLDLAEVQ